MLRRRRHRRRFGKGDLQTKEPRLREVPRKLEGPGDWVLEVQVARRRLEAPGKLGLVRAARDLPESSLIFSKT